MTRAKLVRDKIPAIMRQKGGRPRTRQARRAEYGQLLKAKLREEVEEFLTSDDMAEVADILEVLEAICAHKGFDESQIVAFKTAKARERGGFKKRIILEEIRKS